MNKYLQHVKSILQANGGGYDNLSADGVPLTLDSADPTTNDNLHIDCLMLSEDGRVMACTSEGGMFDLTLLDDEDDFITLDEIVSDAFDVPYLDDEDDDN